MELFKQERNNDYKGCWYNLIVPINEQGAKEILIEPVESIVTENMDYMLLTQSELDTLMTLFNNYNDCFDIIIDVTENEILEYEHLENAKNLAIPYMNTLNDQDKAIVKKLIFMINKALEYHTFLWIYL